MEGRALANSQINQLKTHFNGLNNSQKREFIEKLQKKLQGSINADYKILLNDCIKIYNEETRSIKAGNKSKTRTASSVVTPKTNTPPAPPPKKSGNVIDNFAKKATDFAENVKDEIHTSQTVANMKGSIQKGKYTKHILYGAISIFVGIVTMFVVANFLVGSRVDSSMVVGTWTTEAGTTTFTFRSNGTFSRQFRRGSERVDFSGTWSMSGSRITLEADTSTLRYSDDLFSRLLALDVLDGEHNEQFDVRISGQRMTFTRPSASSSWYTFNRQGS